MADLLINLASEAESKTSTILRRSRTFFRVARGSCRLAFAIGLLVTAVAWFTPFRADEAVGVYDVFASVAFFARVFLLQMAVLWVALGLFALCVRLRWVGVISLVVAVAWAGPEVWAAWPRSPDIAAGRPTFTVASLNLQRSLKDATWAGRVLLDANADFVCLQEVTPASGETLSRLLGPAYPHSLMLDRDSFEGMAIFSKTPLTRVAPPSPEYLKDVEVMTTVLGRPLQLHNVHVSSPHSAQGRRGTRVQLRDLIARLDGRGGPILLTGDFNCTFLTPPAMRLRAAGFVDAKLESGRGSQLTWPTKSSRIPVPAVRIDTAYARGPLQAIDCEVLRPIGSDHRPIKTTWTFAE